MGNEICTRNQIRSSDRYLLTAEDVFKCSSKRSREMENRHPRFASLVRLESPLDGSINHLFLRLQRWGSIIQSGFKLWSFKVVALVLTTVRKTFQAVPSLLSLVEALTTGTQDICVTPNLRTFNGSVRLVKMSIKPGSNFRVPIEHLTAINDCQRASGQPRPRLQEANRLRFLQTRKASALPML